MGSAAVAAGPVPVGRGGGGPVTWERDRNDNDVPDWQEDANYADEAPIRGPDSPRARMGRVGGPGCALPIALLSAGVALAARAALRRRV